MCALSLISLFSGAMGLDLGLEQAGFATHVCVEIDRDCRRTIESNRPRLRYPELTIFGDITRVSPDMLMSASGFRQGDVTLLAGGPPCQAFSTAGRRQSVEDPRGTLVERYFELIVALQPRFFVFENVRGLLSAALKHRPLAGRGEGHPPLQPEEELGSLLKLVILPRFAQTGYEVIYGLVDSADYGVPQNRQRVIFIGSRDHEFASAGIDTLSGLIVPTHGATSGELLPWLNLRDAIWDLRDFAHHEYIPYSQARARVFDRIPPGRNWRYIRDTYGYGMLREIMGGAFTSTGGRVGFWRRLSWEKPSPTLPTSPLHKSTGLCHPDITRPLSVQEYSRIQQFPDDWVFEGSLASRYRQIGNAVPVGLARAIGSGLRRLIDG
ncbi:MAG: DNA cytosine methyltransferase [Bacillota bacterium]|jgi:DNA (cytosine-5)-methyltransferase 1